ncbi:MAG TPA: hypothetical protein VF414_14595 [Thermoanaerobaculia bacterium]
MIRRAAAPILIVFLLAAAPALATQVRIFQIQSQAGFLSGTLEGVSVDSLGRMSLAPRAERLASLAEPFLLSAATLPDGWVVGTGNAGRVLKVDRKGQVTELFAAPEPEVFTVWADPDGTIFAGTSPRGKVYRISGGKGEVFFDPGETYIWALTRAADGGLLVATGTQGKLFKVGKDGKDTVLYDSEDGHLRALEALPDGDVLIGTAGEGLILRLGRDGNARTLYDADEPEVVSLTSAPDGTCYAAVVASESSLVDLAQPAAQAAPGEPQVTVTVEGEAAAEPAPGAMGTRRPGAMGPRSQVLSLSRDGVAETLWGFQEETVYDLLWRQGRLWVATGLEGKLYSWADRQMLLEKDVDERQIVTLLPGEAGPAFATTNAAAFFRVTAETEKTGTYTSAAMDTGQASRFGTFRWRGETPGGSGVRFSFRSGVSSEPDRTWSPWTAAKRGEEISLEGLPRGRYIQWRAELEAGGGQSPRLYNAELSYRQENLRPRIDSLGVLEPGQILVPSNFNPSNQVYEPSHPTREGIFTSVGQPADEDDAGRTKPLWKKGYRTLRWTAADPNQDGLVYDLSFRPAESTSENSEWLKVADELKESYFSFDATALPDGVYRFRLRASDRPSNEPESALVEERVSDPVVIDHTTPVLVKVDRAGGKVRATVRDSANPLREAMFSVDAEDWKPVPSADGLIDGQTETLVVEPEKEDRLLLLRVMDAAYNVVTFNLSEAR